MLSFCNSSFIDIYKIAHIFLRKSVMEMLLPPFADDIVSTWEQIQTDMV